MIKKDVPRKIFKHLALIFALGPLWSGLVDSVKSKPAQISINALTRSCQEAITSSRPNTKLGGIAGPSIYRDKNGDLSVGWKSSYGTFYEGADVLKQARAASRLIGENCPRVHIVVFSPPTGGGEKWLLRRDWFTELHYRDSGYPGDNSKYWKWEAVPFSYDPRKTY